MEPPRPPLTEIIQQFTNAYYHALYKQNPALYQFYREDAELTMAFDNQEVNVRGSQSIKHLHIDLFTNCRNVRIEHVDGQFSASQQLLLINVHGHITLDQADHSRFVQSFLLTEESTATYFIQNDLFRSYGRAPRTSGPEGADAYAVGNRKRSATNGDVSSVKSDSVLSDVDSTNATVGTMSTVTGVFDHDNLPSDVGSESSAFAPKEMNGHMGTGGSVKSDDMSSRDDELLTRKEAPPQQRTESSNTNQSSVKKQEKEQDHKEDAKNKASREDKKPATSEQQQKKPSKKAQKKKKKQKDAEKSEEKPKQPEGPITYASIVGLGAPAATTAPVEQKKATTTAVTSGAASTQAKKKNRKNKKLNSAEGEQSQRNQSTQPKSQQQQKLSKDKNVNAIFVSRLPPDTLDTTLRAHFEKFGKIVEINNKTMATREENPQYYAFIFYEKEESVQKALEQNKKVTIGNSILNIEKRRSDKSTKAKQNVSGTGGVQGSTGAGGNKRRRDDKEQKFRNGRRRANSNTKDGQAKF